MGDSAKVSVRDNYKVLLNVKIIAGDEEKHANDWEIRDKSRMRKNKLCFLSFKNTLNIFRG